jgi:hypothetical protein
MKYSALPSRDGQRSAIGRPIARHLHFWRLEQYLFDTVTAQALHGEPYRMRLDWFECEAAAISRLTGTRAILPPAPCVKRAW